MKLKKFVWIDSDPIRLQFVEQLSQKMGISCLTLRLDNLQEIYLIQDFGAQLVCFVSETIEDCGEAILKLLFAQSVDQSKIVEIYNHVKKSQISKNLKLPLVPNEFFTLLEKLL